MEANFLDILFGQERVVYNRIMNNPLYKQLTLIQELIKENGGVPKYQQVATAKFAVKHASNIDADAVPIIVNQNGYDTKWVWDKKVIYAFKRNSGHATPKQVIDLLIKLEGISSNDKVLVERINSNVYNSISKLSNKQDTLVKDAVERGLYHLSNEEAVLLDTAS